MINKLFDYLVPQGLNLPFWLAMADTVILSILMDPYIQIDEFLTKENSIWYLLSMHAEMLKLLLE